jgi:PAS domain S-box-containing protein
MSFSSQTQSKADLQHGLLNHQVSSGLEGRVLKRGGRLIVWLASVFALSLITWVCFELGFDESMVKCLFLIPIVFLSMMNGLVASIALCATAVLGIDFFFTEPRFTFHIPHAPDLASIATFLVSSLGVTMLVRHMRKLMDVQRKHAQLLDLMRDSVIIRNMEGAILDWNRGAELVYGWKKQEVLGRNSDHLLCTRFPTPLSEIMDTLMRTGHWEGELVQMRRDGSELAISSRWSLQRDENGKPIATLDSGNDISARKRAEDALWRNQATCLAEAQKLSQTGSFGWNASTGEFFWSEQTFIIFDYDMRVVPTITLMLQRVHPDDRERVQQIIEQATTVTREFDFEHRLLTPGGSVKFLRVVAHAVKDDPTGHQYAGAVMDVTGARRAQQQLQATQNELARVTRVTTLGELTASIAHEVGQPLAAIAINSETCLRWLEHTPPRPTEARASVMRIISDSQRAAEIVHRIRTLAKKDPVQMARLDLNDVISGAIPLIQREILEHQISLRLQLSASLPPSTGDLVQLQQVLINLLMNAIQAMEGISARPRELSIESREDGEGNVLVAVRDCGIGIGIGTENESRLFDSFFTTKPQGMGIGLSICRSIVEAHGGKIWATGNTKHGATFQFLLPPISEASCGEESASQRFATVEPPHNTGNRSQTSFEHSTHRGRRSVQGWLTK